MLAMVGILGCSSVNPINAMRLSAVDPLTADPSAIRLYVDVPENIGVQNGSVVLTLYGKNSVLELDVSQDFGLQHVQSSGAHKFQLAQADLPRILALQQQFMGWKNEYPGTSSGGYGASMQPCFVTEVIPLGDMTGAFSLSVETDPDVGPLQLVRNASLRKIAEGMVAGNTDIANENPPLCER